MTTTTVLEDKSPSSRHPQLVELSLVTVSVRDKHEPPSRSPGFPPRSAGRRAADKEPGRLHRPARPLSAAKLPSSRTQLPGSGAQPWTRAGGDKDL